MPSPVSEDEIVGAAIAAMHRALGRQWTLDNLAEEAATSRSVLTERFARSLGGSPLAYLRCGACSSPQDGFKHREIQFFK